MSPSRLPSSSYSATLALPPPRLSVKAVSSSVPQPLADRRLGVVPPRFAVIGGGNLLEHASHVRVTLSLRSGCSRVSSPQARYPFSFDAQMRRAMSAGHSAQRISIHEPTAIMTAPLTCAPRRLKGTNFSKATHAVNAAMTTTSITPPANSSSISAQQQPMQ